MMDTLMYFVPILILAVNAYLHTLGSRYVLITNVLVITLMILMRFRSVSYRKTNHPFHAWFFLFHWCHLIILCIILIQNHNTHIAWMTIIYAIICMIGFIDSWRVNRTIEFDEIV